MKYPRLSDSTSPASRSTFICWDTAASDTPSLLATAPAQMSWFSRIVTIENLVSSDRALRMPVMSSMVSLFK